MKTKLLLFVFSILLFASCEGEGKYTVWTGEMDYYAFQSQIGINFELYDGNYIRTEISKEQWESAIEPMLLEDADNDRHRWKKEKIYDWLIGRGFGSEEARKESSWITTVNHGMILSRDKNKIHVLFK